MGRWDNLADEDRLQLKENQLPAADILALERAFGSRPRPRSNSEGGRLPSKATIQRWKQCYGRWAGHLKRIGRLDPSREPIERLTEENLDSFFVELVTLGLAGHTINGYFEGLRQAFQRMCPGHDFNVHHASRWHSATPPARPDT